MIRRIEWKSKYRYPYRLGFWGNGFTFFFLCQSLSVSLNSYFTTISQTPKPRVRFFFLCFFFLFIYRKRKRKRKRGVQFSEKERKEKKWKIMGEFSRPSWRERKRVKCGKKLHKNVLKAYKLQKIVNVSFPFSFIAHSLRFYYSLFLSLCVCLNSWFFLVFCV